MIYALGIKLDLCYWGGQVEQSWGKGLNTLRRLRKQHRLSRLCFSVGASFVEVDDWCVEPRRVKLTYGLAGAGQVGPGMGTGP